MFLKGAYVIFWMKNSFISLGLIGKAVVLLLVALIFSNFINYFSVNEFDFIDHADLEKSRGVIGFIDKNNNLITTLTLGSGDVLKFGCKFPVNGGVQVAVFLIQACRERRR